MKPAKERTNRTTCPYCMYDFRSEALLDNHVPCPSNAGDNSDSPKEMER